MFHVWRNRTQQKSMPKQYSQWKFSLGGCPSLAQCPSKVGRADNNYSGGADPQLLHQMQGRKRILDRNARNQHSRSQTGRHCNHSTGTKRQPCASWRRTRHLSILTSGSGGPRSTTRLVYGSTLDCHVRNLLFLRADNLLWNLWPLLLSVGFMGMDLPWNHRLMLHRRNSTSTARKNTTQRTTSAPKQNTITPQPTTTISLPPTLSPSTPSLLRAQPQPSSNQSPRRNRP